MRAFGRNEIHGAKRHPPNEIVLPLPDIPQTGRAADMTQPVLCVSIREPVAAASRRSPSTFGVSTRGHQTKSKCQNDSAGLKTNSRPGPKATLARWRLHADSDRRPR